MRCGTAAARGDPSNTTRLSARRTGTKHRRPRFAISAIDGSLGTASSLFMEELLRRVCPRNTSNYVPCLGLAYKGDNSGVNGTDEYVLSTDNAVSTSETSTYIHIY